MNKYLITGGSGFIGTNLVNYIRKRNPSAQLIVVSYAEPHYTVDNCKYIVCNIANTEKYEHYIDRDTTVVHLAWSGFPNIEMKNIFDGISNNIINSYKLFEVAINHSCRTIVFLSSGGGIYGKPLTLPIKETHPTTPLSYYGIEKLAVENYLRLMTSNSSTKAVILRASNPYGRFQRPFTGQGVISTFLASALLNRPVEVWGNGNAVRDYYYIDDLSEAIVMSTNTDDKCIVANIGSGNGFSINDIIKTIEKVSKKKLSVRCVGATNAETGTNILDCSLAKEKFGWKTRYPLEEGISQMMTAWNIATEQFDRGICE